MDYQRLVLLLTKLQAQYYPYIFNHVFVTGATVFPISRGRANPSTKPGVVPNNNASVEVEVRQMKKGIVEINDIGWVVAKCPGRQRWLADMREGVQRWLDVSISKFAMQHRTDWQNVIDGLAAKWEYVGNPDGIAVECLERHAGNIIKNDRYKLHDIWKKGKCDPRMPAPSICDPTQWSKLIRNFQSEAFKKSAAQATIAREHVQTPNYMGRAGNASIKAKLVRRLNLIFYLKLVSVFNVVMSAKHSMIYDILVTERKARA